MMFDGLAPVLELLRLFMCYIKMACCRSKLASGKYKKIKVL